MQASGGTFQNETLSALNSVIAQSATSTTNVATNTTNIATNTAAIATLQTQLGQMLHAKYSFAVDGGVVGPITPATNCTIPANFVIQNVALNSVGAVLATGGACTVSVGLSAGGAGAAALVAATSKTSWTANAFVQGIPVPQDVTKWIKMSAEGTVTITIATNAVTAGIIEIYIFGYQSAS